MRIALYLRTSHTDRTTENQRRELRAACDARGWTIVAEYQDEGVSGARGRDTRPGLDNALRAAVRGEFDTLAAWSVDRLGRSLQDLIATLHELNASGRGLYLHKQALDTATPSGRALFGMLGVFAEFERAMIAERVRAGMARARAAGRTFGRPALAAPLRRRALDMIAAGKSDAEIARAVGCHRRTITRIRLASRRA